MEENNTSLTENLRDFTSSPVHTKSSVCIKEYRTFCQRNCVLPNIQQRAYHYLRDLISQDILENELKIDQAELFASVLYMALIDARLPYGPSDPHLERGSLEPPSMTVTDILFMADININKLFQMMDVVKARLTLSQNSIQTHLTQMERNYCIVSALFHTFANRLCTSVFRNENTTAGMDDGCLPRLPESEGVEFRKKQCWILFLLSKYHLFQDRLELYQHLQLLLCCLEFVLRQSPSFLLNSPYDAFRFEYFSTNQGAPMLTKLAEEYNVPADETLQLQLQVTEPYFQALLNEDGQLDSDSLCEQYKKIYEKEGDLDEMLFLNKDLHLLPPQICRVNNQFSEQPKLLPEQMTPVRVVMGTVQHLQENFAKLPDEPNEKLKSYFQKCVQDPNEVVKNLISMLRGSFIQQYQTSSPSTCQAAVAEQRFTLGLKLYFKVLLTMMDNEGDRLSQDVLNTLLNKENFHKSLLACAMEVVLITYGQSWKPNLGELSTEGAAFSFPWILKVFSIQAYEFYKVIESFIKSEPKLTADVVKHLQNIEVRILDSLAWRESSSLFDVLGDWDQGQMTPPIPASPIKMSETANGGPHIVNGLSKCAVDLFLSPIRQSQMSATIAATLPSSCTLYVLPVPLSPLTKQSSSCADNPGNDAGVCRFSAIPRSQSLSHFLKRVCSLGFARLSKLCGHLQVSKDLQQKIWTCFEHCVTRLPTLLRNRHIDQIIMCCIYGICRVADQEIRFKSIVSEYKNLPHARQEVFRDVYISQDKQDSIINFYNNIFMQELKPFLLQFSPNRHLRPQLSPMPRQAQASPSCYSLPGRKNITVSPLRESPFKAPASPGLMTPRTKLLYNFGETSSEKLREFNETINARVGPATAKKRLNMDDVMGSPASKAKKAF